MTLLQLLDFATTLKRLASKPKPEDPEWNGKLKATLDALCIAWGTHGQPKLVPRDNTDVDLAQKLKEGHLKIAMDRTPRCEMCGVEVAPGLDCCPDCVGLK